MERKSEFSAELLELRQNRLEFPEVAVVASFPRRLLQSDGPVVPRMLQMKGENKWGPQLFLHGVRCPRCFWHRIDRHAAGMGGVDLGWSYTGAGSNAGGTFRTLDMADSSGFYLIVDIAGFRDGDPITGLQPTGTSIPGNSPFVVDNLISISGPQLTGDGFGFSTASGDFANVFFADFLPVPGYLEFFSVPPFAANVGPEDSELQIAFSAMPRVPEPATSALLAFGIVGLVMARTRRRTPSSVAPRDGVAMHNRPDDNSALRGVPDSTHAAA